jgi:hypothetical protein
MIEQLSRINLAEDLCPRKIALKAALMVEKSYKQELNLESKRLTISVFIGMRSPMI